MKFLFSLMMMFASTQLFAANVEMGKYTAFPIDYPTAIASIELIPEDKAVVSIDIDGMLVSCEGTFKIEETWMAAHVFCDHDMAPEVNVAIDFSNVTPEGLRSEEGVVVSAKFDLMGDEEILFNLKKAD